MTIRTLLAPVFGLGLLLGSQTVLATTMPGAFTATYNVSQGGEPMGVATVTLRSAGHGEWIYSKDVKSTGGLAAMLGASLTEASRFRWKGDAPEAVSYDYQLQTGIKNKQRHMTVDWASNQVTLDEGKGPQTYPASPGMVERNTTSLALGLALRDGKQQITLPVAVRQQGPQVAVSDTTLPLPLQGMAATPPPAFVPRSHDRVSRSTMGTNLRHLRGTLHYQICRKCCQLTGVELSITTVPCEVGR